MGNCLTVSLLKRLGFAVAAAGLLLASCAAPPAQQGSNDALTETPQGEIARLPRPRAGDDFYAHVNSDWLNTYELPADKAAYGVTTELADVAEAEVRTMIEQLIASHPKPGTLEQKIADLYSAALDVETIETRGIDPLRPHLERMRSARTYDDLTDLMGVIGYASPISAGVAPSPAEPDANAVWIYQTGLGMPHRGYYLDIDLKSTALQVAYRRHVATILSLLGYPDPESGAQRIYNLEYLIAQAHTDEDRSMSAAENMKAMNYAQLKAFAPGFDWDRFLASAGFAGADRFVITNYTAVPALAALFHRVPIDDWKLWLEFHYASDFAPYLPKAFSDSAFDFFERQLSGVTERPPRWKFAVDIVNSELGDAVGQLYVQRHFSPQSKGEVDGIVANIRRAFEMRIRNLDWMDDKTRAAALVKLAALQGMIGYPDTWIDYSGLTVEPGMLPEAIYSGALFELQQMRADLNRPVDRRQWPTPPHVVNAFYIPFGNIFFLPAGILQPPYYDPKADPAENYGGIGAVIGHEMSHGFDDEGRQFDSTGRNFDWWTDATDDRFLERSDRLIEQYNGYCPYAEACVNGLGTLGENIGDLAGLEIAYAAWRLSLGGKEAPVINGLTGDQRFFIAYARTYREKIREELARALLEGDSHAPSQYRVNGVVRNMDAWYAAFNVKPGDRLYLRPEQRVKMW